MCALRPPASSLSQVWRVSDLFPPARKQRSDPRDPKGKLVKESVLSPEVSKAQIQSRPPPCRLALSLQLLRSRRQQVTRGGLKGSLPRMMTDPIADMLTRLRNAVRIERPYVDVPLCKMSRGIATVLRDEGFVWGYEEIETVPSGTLRIELK